MAIHTLYCGGQTGPKGQKYTKKQLDSRPFYYFIRDGDFDIVWPNVAVFIVGHLFYLYSCFLLCTDFPWRTWFWGEFDPS